MKDCCQRVRKLARYYEEVWELNRDEYLKLSRYAEDHGEKYLAKHYRELAVIWARGAREFGFVANMEV